MLTLYAAPADPTADAIARTLELLAVPYVRRDPAADLSAAAQLRALTGELTTPTHPNVRSVIFARPRLAR